MDDALAPGRAIGRYVIQAKLGEGGMGVVYRARDSQLNRVVAIKVLRPRADQDAASWVEARTRLLREAQAAAALAHPAIVTLFDVGELDGLPFLAMEYIEGSTLRDLVARRQVSRGRSIAWLRTIAEALGTAHRAGIVHRDVKPENVMVRDDGSVKVLDFGIARAVESPVSARTTPQLPTLTGEGAVVGTVAYMAPEQIGGDAVDGRMDQFSWGVVAYELLSGRSPWTPLTDPLVVVSAILTKEPVPLGEVVPDLPREVAAVVTRALMKDRSRRFPTMEELLVTWPGAPASSGVLAPGPSVRAELDSLGHARTESAAVLDSRRAPTLPPAGDGVRAHRTWIAVVAVALSALVVGVVYIDPQEHRKESGPTHAAEASAPKPVTLLDLPMPASANPAALAAYREGLVAERNGENNAYRRFERAVELDPALGGAYVQTVVQLVDVPGPENRAIVQEDYRRALAERERLSPRDRAIVDAYEPVVLGQPPDWAATERKVRALVQAWPLDADLSITLADIVVHHHRKAADVDAVIARAVALDPGAVDAWTLKLRRQRITGDLAGARATGRACLEALPASTQCLQYLTDLDDMEGKCDDAESLSHRYIATSPDDAWGYIQLFESELARGAPEAALVVTEARMLARIEPAARSWAAIRYPWLRAVVRGDFTDAERLLDQQEAVALREVDLGDQLRALYNRAELALEEGDVIRAGKAADAFLAKRSALDAPQPTQNEIWRDHTPLALRVMRLASRLTRDEAIERRDLWLHDWQARMGGEEEEFLWLEAYARPAITREDAEEAIAHAPASLEVLLYGTELEPEAVGRMYLLAGQADKALPLLENASRQCFIRRFPFEIPRASYFVGLAREALGDKAGACSGYQSVIRRWGSAKPKSVTAALSLVHARALACELPR